MLANSKLTLFDNTMRLKLENPEMTLDHWMSHIDKNRCTFRVEKVSRKKKMMGGKRFGYKVTTSDPLWTNCVPAVRSKSDFHLLQLQLEKRFPDAVVPRVQKKELDNIHMTELYLTELSLNPFFRMDVAFSDFLNGKQKEYKQTKKNDRKHSQGTLRWLQQTTEYKDVEVTDETIKSIKNDLDQLRRASNSLIAGLAVQIKTMADLQDCAGTVCGTLGEFLAVEQSSENKAHGSASGLPPGQVKGRVTKLISLHEDYQMGLNQSYDGGILERGSVDYLILFVREIQAFKRVIDLVSSAKSDFDRAQHNFESTPNENPHKDSIRQTVAQKEIVFFKGKSALMFELEKFRTYKTIKIEVIYKNLCKFHLRGAKRIMDEWSKSGITLDPREEQEFLQNNQIYANESTNPRGKDRSKSHTLSRSIKKPLELKSLEVVQGYSPGMLSSRFLKVSKGELLTGHQLDNGDWQVTNNNGQKGVVKSEYIQLASQQNGYRPAQPGPAPGLPQIQNNREEDEWSLSDDEDADKNFGAITTTGINQQPRQPAPPPSKPTPPTGFGLPPGFPGSSAPKPPTGGGFPGFGKSQPTPPPSTPSGFGQPLPSASFNKPSPPTGGFGQPTAPPSNRFNAAPPSAGFNQPNPPPSNRFNGAPNGGFGQPTPPPSNNFNAAPSGGFGMPTPPPSNSFNAAPSGGFGMPGNQASSPGFSGAPIPPASKPVGFGKGPKAPASKPKAGGMFGGGSKKKKTGKPKIGGGMPARPGGGPSFLADISKGNNMKKLKKVPESEKSKEIGGAKGLSAADKAKGKKAAPAMGGGGLMGEMAMAFARKRG